MTEATTITLRNIATVILLAAAVAMLMACAAPGGSQTVKIPVPVACQENEPTRPVMPTERLQPGATLDSFVQAATAEIERREGYETELVAALRACIAPIEPK